MTRLFGAALLAAVMVQPATEPSPVEGEGLTARVTFYTLRGVMYSGRWTYDGAAACSWNFPIGTALRLSDGRVVVCEDRGHLGSSPWLDIWVPSLAHGQQEVAAVYGDWAAIEVIERTAVCEEYQPC